MDYCMVETNKRGLDLPPKTCQYFHKNVCLRETFPQWKVATSSGVLWSGFEVKALKSNSHYHIK
ncbi:hypothetical protein KP509_11G055600 [Ceratopteris richardii]|uniref:Uncharacterized protein n=1 Tax=Ceratopteris richardii TaxID=49495 RepID=A0A8T2TVI8_CERRI|nr:hypothetical protein KP509_11G055600 [Ceratopteris richardii]